MQKRRIHKNIYFASGDKDLNGLVYGGLDGIVTAFAVVATTSAISAFLSKIV